MNRLLILLPCLALLSSCKLLQLPVRAVGGVARGTSELVQAPGRAYDKRKARKEAEKRQREAKENAARGGNPTLDGSSSSFGSGGPAFGESPSLDGGTALDGSPSTLPEPVEGGPGPTPSPASADPPLPDFGP